jgi:hypothetical protein
MGRSSEETKLSKAIRERLKVEGVMHERVQCGIVPLRHGSFMHLASPGTPDVWTSLGWIEVKDKSDLSQEQLAWHAKARHNNVRVTVARSPDEAMAAIENWKRLDKEKMMAVEQDDPNEIQHRETAQGGATETNQQRRVARIPGRVRCIQRRAWN